MCKQGGTPWNKIAEMVLCIHPVFGLEFKLISISILQAIRYFIVNVIVKVSSDETTLTKEHTYINKLNMVLVQVSSRLIGNMDKC